MKTSKKNETYKKYDYNTHTAGYVIGFANVMYTLWYVSDQVWSDNFGDHCTSKCEFQKNLTKSLEKAQSFGLDIDTSLRGHTDFVIDRTLAVESPEKEPETGTFNFGKYYKKTIAECTDASYLMWYGDNDELNTNACRARLEELGHYYIPYVGYVNTDEYKEYTEFKKDIAEHNPVNIHIEYNPNKDGHIKIHGTTFKFDTVYVPAGIYPAYYTFKNPKTSKGMRLKNKNIQITKYTVKNDVVIVKEFKKL